MPYDENGCEIISAAAWLDEEDHRRRCALELTKMEAPTRRPTPIRSGITQAQLDKQIGDMLKRIGEILGEHFATIRKRLEELESTSMGKYCGTWQEGGNYEPGNFVTASGSLWHCRARTGTRPGTCPEAWTLVAKKGRDAR